MQLVFDLVEAAGVFVHRQRDHAHLLAKIAKPLAHCYILSASVPI
jgi:hypothetical protein